MDFVESLVPIDLIDDAQLCVDGVKFKADDSGVHRITDSTDSLLATTPNILVLKWMGDLVGVGSDGLVHRWRNVHQLNQEVTVETTQLLIDHVKDAQIYMDHGIPAIAVTGEVPLTVFRLEPSGIKASTLKNPLNEIVNIRVSTLTRQLYLLDVRGILTVLDMSSLVILERIRVDALSISLGFCQDKLILFSYSNDSVSAWSTRPCKLLKTRLGKMNPMARTDSDESIGYQISKDGSMASLFSFKSVDQRESALKLIKEGHIKEAFATGLFLSLEFEELCKSRALSIECVNETTLPLFCDLLDQIHDMEFITSRCFDIETGSLQVQQRLFEYASTKLQDREDKQRLQQLSRRLTTFGLYYASELHKTWNFKVWREFQVFDMPAILQHEFCRGNQVRADLLWQRHGSVEQFDHSRVVKALYDIDVSASTPSCRILHSILASIRDPETRVEYYQWAHVRTMALLQHHSSPFYAFEFFKFATQGSNLSSKPITPSETLDLVCGLNGDAQVSESPQMMELEAFKTGLVDLIYLWESLDFKISWSEYKSLTPSLIAIDMLDKVSAVELLPDLLTQKIQPYLSRHHLDLDTLLMDYCNEILDARSSYQYSYDTAEERVLVLIECIGDYEVSAAVLIELMRRASVPWSASLDACVSKFVQQVHPRNEAEILEQRRLMRMKLIAAKYGIDDFNVSDLERAKGLMEHVASCVDVETVLSDLEEVVAVYKHLSIRSAYILRCQYLIEASQSRVAQSLLELSCDNMSMERLVSIYEELMYWILEKIKVSALAKSKAMFVKFLDAATFIITALNEKGCQTMYQLTAKDILGCRELIDTFDVLMTPFDFCDCDKKAFVFKEILTRQTQLDEPLLFKLSDTLALDRVMTTSLIAIANAGQGNVLHAILLLKNLNWLPGCNVSPICDALECILKVTMSLDQLKQGQQTLDIVQSLLKVCQRVLASCDGSHIQRSLELFKSLELLERIVMHSEEGEYRVVSSTQVGSSKTTIETTTSTFGSSLFKEQYHEGGLVLPLEPTLPETTEFVLSLAKLFQSVHEPVKASKGKGRADQNDWCDFGLRVATMLYDYRNYQSSLRAQQLIIEYSRRSPFAHSFQSNQDPVFSTLHSKTMKALLHNLLISHPVESGLALGCMISLPIEEAFAAFKSGMATTGQEYTRLRAIAEVGGQAGSIWNQRSFQVDCERLYMNARWWTEFKLLLIPFDETKFRQQPYGEYHKELLRMYISKCGDLEAALEFAENHHFGDDFVYHEFIKKAFESSDADYQSDVRLVIGLVDNKLKLSDFLIKTILPHILTWDYAKIGFLLKCCSSVDPAQQQVKKYTTVLDLLSNYTRTSLPFAQELECASKDSIMFSKRLPFHELLQDPNKVLTDEASDANIMNLAPLAMALSISMDKLQLVVIQKVISREMNKANVLDGKFGSGTKFSHFKPHLSKLKDHEGAVNMCLHIAQLFSNGQERVIAYRHAMSCSEKWHNASSSKKDEKTNVSPKDEAGKVFTKVRLMLAQTETEVQLTDAGLQEYRSFISNPTELVVQLFKSCQIHRIALIHSVIAQVGKKHEIEVDKVRLMLLQRYLSEDLPDDSAKTLANELGKIGFLFGTDTQRGAHILISFAYQKSARVTTGERIRAMQAFFLVLNTGTENRYNESELEQFKGYLKMLMFIREFDGLKVVWSTSELDKCDKGALVKSLWLSHRSHPQGLRLIIQLCLDFDVRDTEVFSNAIKALLSMNQVLFVLEIFEKVAGSNAILCSPSLWQYLFETCLLKLEDTAVQQQFLIVLSMCPILLNVEPIKRLSNFNIPFEVEIVIWSILSFNQPGLDILPMLTDQRMPMLDESDLVQTIQVLHSKDGILDHSALHFYSNISRECVYDFVDAHGLFHLLESSSSLVPFTQYLIQNNHIENLLALSLRDNLFEEAKILILMYMKAYPHFVESFEEEKRVESIMLALLEKSDLLDESLQSIIQSASFN